MTDAKAARYSWEIEVEDAGERLDKFLANQLGMFPVPKSSNGLKMAV